MSKIRYELQDISEKQQLNAHFSPILKRQLHNGILCLTVKLQIFKT